ncbi:hypothetical protein A0H76_2269 [Hepatospora eriocheir]|uniref:Uncharacterized protein n=1 Tax=Hepatospora eriocheir TaxID=1081669 RepID=A0A1X0QFN6_9MICR|nr:hypothetical protein A0H76_2269 [Hepatospora eriocheir]
MHFHSDDKKTTKKFHIEPTNDNKVNIIDSIKGRCLCLDEIDNNRFNMEDCNSAKSNQEFVFSVESPYSNRFYLARVNIDNAKFFTKEGDDLVLNSHPGKAVQIKTVPINENEGDDSSEVQCKIMIFDENNLFYLNNDGSEGFKIQDTFSTPWLVTDIKKSNEIRISDIEGKNCLTAPNVNSPNDDFKLYRCSSHAINTQFFRKHTDPVVLLAE